MKISVRKGVFETNSSSTHSLCMCSESDYDKWENGELFYHIYSQKFATKEEILEEAKSKREEYIEIKKEQNGKWYNEDYINAKTDEELLKLSFEDEDKEWYGFGEFWDYIESNYETFEEEYTTNDGDKVISFGYFGYEG